MAGPESINVPRRFGYGPQWRQIFGMLALGVALLVLVGAVSFGWGMALGFLPLMFVLAGTLRRLFLPRFLELHAENISIASGFLQKQVTVIPYAEIGSTSEVRRGRMTTFQLRTKLRAFEINSMLLPDMASYVAVRDFIISRITPKTETIPPVEAGIYGFRCSYEGDGEIYDSNGGILWRFKTLHRRPHYPYGLFHLPDFVTCDGAGRECFRIKLTRKWGLARFMMLENGLPVCTISQQSILRNKFTLIFADGKKWVFHLPLFSVCFGGRSETGEAIRVRVRTHNIWHLRVDAKADNVALTVALAFIHRERLRFN